MKRHNDLHINFYDDDRKYAIAIYLTYIVLTSLMIIFSNKYYNIVQAELNAAFFLLTVVLIINMMICLWFCIRRKSVHELYCLVTGITTIALLVLEKTIAFCWSDMGLSFGVYLDYISVNVFKLAFLVYRYFKVKMIISEKRRFLNIIKDDRSRGSPLNIKEEIPSE